MSFLNGNNELIKKKKEINHFFKKNINSFKKMIKNSYNLQYFSSLLETDFVLNLIDFSNYLIFDLLIKKNKKLDVTNFNIDYHTVLKSICLLSLVINNNYTTNIFKYDFSGKHNPYVLENKIDVDPVYFDQLKIASNNIFSYAYYLHSLIKSNIDIKEFYEIIVNIVLLLVILNSNSYSKKILFFKTIKKKYTEKYTENYLKTFKLLRNEFKKYFPNIFNELIFTLNSFK